MAGAVFWGLNDKGFSSNEAPLYATDPWDTFFAAGFQFPGLCEIHGMGSSIEWESKKGKGRSGARFTSQGYKPQPFEVTCEIATSDQWDTLQQIIDLLWSPETGPVKATQVGFRLAITVDHPDLQRLKIGRAILIGLPFWQPGKMDGTKVFRFQFIEYKPPTEKTQTKSAKGAALGAAPEIRKGQVPKNATSAPPSSDRKNARLTGPPSTPVGGSS